MGGWVGGRWVVGKSDFKENPKSDLDLDLWFVNIQHGRILDFENLLSRLSVIWSDLFGSRRNVG